MPIEAAPIVVDPSGDLYAISHFPYAQEIDIVSC